MFFGARAQADLGEGPIHSNADYETWDRKTNIITLTGHAAVRQPGESLTADVIVFNRNTHNLDATGNCTYIAEGTVIYGDEMHFNLDTRTGTVIGGRVSTDKFTLSGERLNKLGLGRFQTHWGEYSTCRDCPQSWTFRARDVDMQIEGYAYMSDVVIKVDEDPALWLPYLVIPMKTHRQTGFLFPEYGFGTIYGTTFVQPFFWAINRSSDMTVGLGAYAARGLRGEWEGRYALSGRSGGKANFWYLHDRVFAGDLQYNPSGNANRWGLEASQVQDLPWHVEEKVKLIAVSDNAYPVDFNDVSQVQEAFLHSVGSLAYSSPLLSGTLDAQVFRNILNFNPDLRKFDTTTVQELPRLTLATDDQLIPGTPLIGGITLSATRFSRGAGPFDKDFINPNPVPGTYVPGQDPLREATRYTIVPSLYTTLTPIDGFTLMPSIRFFNYYYNFTSAYYNDGTAVPPLYRSYPLLQLDLSTEIQRIYDTGNPIVPKRKHLIRPILTYSNIPFVHQNSSHPFIGQINYLASQQFNDLGYNFDDTDIVPQNNNPFSQIYFTPLGNSLTYGFVTDLIEKVQTPGVDAAAYRTPVEWGAGQTFDFRQYAVNSGNPEPLSRFYSTLITNYLDKFVTNTTYYYYPYVSGLRHELHANLTYILERGLHQRVLAFDRSISLSYNLAEVGYTSLSNFNGLRTNVLSASANLSLNDYILPTFQLDYDFVGHQLLDWTLGLQLQSPSQCWKVTTGVSFQLAQGRNFAFPSISLNLTGSGFEGVNDLSQAGAAH